MSQQAIRALVIGAVVAGVIALGSMQNNASAPSSPGEGTVSHSSADELLGLHNRGDDAAKPNTPRQFLGDATHSALSAAGTVISEGWNQGGRVYQTGSDPTLNLIYEAGHGNVQQMRTWLERGGDPNKPDPYKSSNLETALMAAVRSGNAEAVGVLLPHMTAEGRRARNRGNATALAIAQSLRNGARTIEDGKRFHEIEALLESAGVPE